MCGMLRLRHGTTFFYGSLFDIQPPIPPGSSQSYGWRHHHNQFPTLHKNSKKAIKIPRGLHSARANRTIAHRFMKTDEEMIGERKSEIKTIADRKFQNKHAKFPKILLLSPFSGPFS
jgi:hypothetical protein